MSSKPSSPLANEIEVVRRLYAAINRNDVPAALELLDPEIVRVEPEGFPTAGTYRGLAAMKVHLGDGRSKWAEGECKPERLIASGDKVVALLHVLVRLKGKQDWIDGRMGDGFRFRGGKILEMRSFADPKAAMAWAGVVE